jgi:phosphatidate phosphatase APP1
VSHTLRVVVFVGLLLCSLGVAGVAVADDPQHEHPDETDDDADLAAVERWLGDNMGEIHADCSEGINVGNFDACEDLDEEYKSYLDRYVTVQGDVGGEQVEERIERFNETRQQQAELAELMQEFNRTYDDYREARAAGNETRARAEARELRRLADRIRELGGELAVNFRELDGSVSADLNMSANVTRETTQEVVTLTNSVEQETFETTETAISVDQVATFREPATVTGTVYNSTGAPLPNATVVVADGPEQRTVRTNATGQFRTIYRPTVVEAGAQNVTVNYVPADASEYLGSNATATVEVRPVASSVTITNATTAARFNETVSVRGAVHATDQSVPGVPVTVYIGDRALARTRTDSAGEFATTLRVPVDVPAGNRTLSVRASEADRAISASRARTPLSVLSTSTNLSANAVYTADSDGIQVTGRLTAENADEVGERPLTVRVNGEEYSTTTTVNGGYTLNVNASEGPHDIAVRYDEPGTNLQPATAETSLEPDEPLLETVLGTIGSLTDAVVSFVRSSPVIAGIAGVALTVNAIIWPLVWRSRRESTKDPDDVDEAPVDETAESTTTDLNRSRAMLDAARGQLEQSPTDAVQAGYAAVRAGLDGSSNDTAGARTHWEFYHSVSDELDGDRASALRSVTEAFEQATFAPDGIDSSSAAAMLDDAERCLTAGDGGTTD